MTPAQRKYDQDLVAAMHNMAQRIAPRSRKISDTLKIAAARLDVLSASAPVTTTQTTTQPASTPDKTGEGTDGGDTRRTSTQVR